MPDGVNVRDYVDTCVFCLQVSCHFLGTLMNCMWRSSKITKTSRQMFDFLHHLVAILVPGWYPGRTLWFYWKLLFWKCWPCRVNENISDIELKSSPQLLSPVIILHESPWSHITAKLPIINSLGWNCLSPYTWRSYLHVFFFLLLGSNININSCLLCSPEEVPISIHLLTDSCLQQQRQA